MQQYLRPVSEAELHFVLEIVVATWPRLKESLFDPDAILMDSWLSA